MDEHSLSKSEIYELANFVADNAQDGVILALLFKRHTLEEISELKVTDIAKDDLRYKDIYPLIYRAISENNYIVVEDDKIKMKPIIKTDYVVRNEYGKKLETNELKSRVKKVLDIVDYQYVNEEDIRESGRNNIN